MRINWFFLIVFYSATLTGQEKADYGIFGGTSSYLGDINSERFLYSPRPAAGLFYRFNFNPRQSVRGDLFVGGISGNDLDFNNSFQQSRAMSFNGMVGEFALQYEFNFFPYSTIGTPTKKRNRDRVKLYGYTPYLAAGFGAAITNSATIKVIPVIPFSLGFKINLFKNIGLEAEYGFRKTFYDNFDGLNDLVTPEDYALIHNNDWYTFAGISVTWKMMSRLAGCPVYEDADSKRKR